MNPFDLAGPQFLLFYAILGVVVNVALRSFVRALGAERSVSLSALSADPYQIAYLRGGEEETVKIAVISLVDRNLLRFDEGRLRSVDERAPRLARRPLEQAILSHCVAPRLPDEVLRGPQVQRACDDYRNSLTQSALIESETQRAARRRAVLLAVGVLVGAAGWKVLTAMSRGRPNFGFLVILAIVFVLAALLMLRGRRTGLGENTLANLRTLFARLNRRATSIRPGGATNEAVLLAAVFGVYSLPSLAFPYLDELFPRRTKDSSGSTCGGGSSSGCGGGGSSGGGCGGCGGGGD